MLTFKYLLQFSIVKLWDKIPVWNYIDLHSLGISNTLVYRIWDLLENSFRELFTDFETKCVTALPSLCYHTFDESNFWLWPKHIEKKICHIFQPDKNIQLWFRETWWKYNETGFSSTNWLSVLFSLFLAHTHTVTHGLSLWWDIILSFTMLRNKMYLLH